MTRIGSLFSGVGGLCWGVEHATGGRVAWQLDLVNAAVRHRHWPDALQVEADIATVDPLDLPRVDVLCGGFSCQDLSCAGTQGGLIDGTRTGPTYRGLVRFAEALRPDLVVMENVPALLGQWRDHLEHDWGRMGYGLTWVQARALDVGAPHLRARVFVVAERGVVGRGVLEAPRDGEWMPEDSAVEWPTPRDSDGRRGGGSPSRVRNDRQSNQPDCLPTAVARSVGTRPWPTTTANDAKTTTAENYSTESGRHSGTTLTDAIRPWPTATARDFRVDYGPDHERHDPGSKGVALSAAAAMGKRLSPAWCETLVGLPRGWTLPNGPRMEIDPSPRWPRGRYPESWDRSIPWPGYDWEPARTLPDGPPCPGRPARIRACGNIAVPQQAALAVRTGLERRQVPLFGGGR